MFPLPDHRHRHRCRRRCELKNQLWTARDIDKLEMPQKDLNSLSVALVFFLILHSRPQFPVHFKLSSLTVFRFCLLCVRCERVCVCFQSRRWNIWQDEKGKNAHKIQTVCAQRASNERKCTTKTEKTERNQPNEQISFWGMKSFVSGCDKFAYYLYVTCTNSPIRTICWKM